MKATLFALVDNKGSLYNTKLQRVLFNLKIGQNCTFKTNLKSCISITIERDYNFLKK